jgi:hypothetical protein
LHEGGEILPFFRFAVEDEIYRFRDELLAVRDLLLAVDPVKRDFFLGNGNGLGIVDEILAIFVAKDEMLFTRPEVGRDEVFFAESG